MPGREAEECFPDALRHRFDAEGASTGERAEPIAADFRDAGDGKRMGFLKLVAGMLGVGLDELARREAQRRQRRLTWLAAASLAGMAVTSGLAVAAIDARDDARDQRDRAEGLIEFMLGDLRGKLQPVGRLDLLDSVGEKALDYYRRQPRGSLTEDGLGRRSRALHLIGEIANLRGDLAGALRRFEEAEASTAETLARAPDDQQRIFDHAQSVFWVGYVAWQRGQTKAAADKFKEYKRLALRLIDLDPRNLKWRLEGIYADSNLGTLLIGEEDYAGAARVFDAAYRGSEALVKAEPGNREYLTQLADSLAWLADAQRSAGDLAASVATRQRELAILARLDPADTDGEVKHDRLIAHNRLGTLFSWQGDIPRALDHARAAAAIARELSRIEPGNTKWADSAAAAHVDLAQLLMLKGDLHGAAVESETSCALARILVEREPSVTAWRTQTLQSCLVMSARLALERGDLAEARQIASTVFATAQAEVRAKRPGAGRALAAAHQLLADIGDKSGDRDAARQGWRAALAALPDTPDSEPDGIARRSILLHRIGRGSEARPLDDKLRAIGYRHPRYLKWTAR
jgi:tetratricopeptide (TPR) repeat protein